MESTDQLLYDPFLAEVHDNPYPIYARLRAEAPLYRNADRGFWALSRYGDVVAAARDWRSFSSAGGADPDQAPGELGLNSFLDLDPPRHDELRKVTRDYLNPRSLNALEPLVRRKVNTLLDGLSDTGTVDLGVEFAWRLPLDIIGQLIGFPEEDMPQLEHWVHSLTHRDLEPDVPDPARETAGKIREYFEAMARARRTSPSPDLFGAMVEAERAGRMTLRELGDMCFILFMAGFETTASFISNSLFLLTLHPEVRAALIGDPSSLPGAIEELLRYEAPVQLMARTVTQDVELYGQRIAAGDRVFLLFGSANRDSRKFDDGDRLDIRRPPARHLAFGEGIHHCVGAPLARLESRIALEAFLGRFPRYETCGPVERHRLMTTWGFENLPVVLDPASG